LESLKKRKLQDQSAPRRASGAESACGEKGRGVLTGYAERRKGGGAEEARRDRSLGFLLERGKEEDTAVETSRTLFTSVTRGSVGEAAVAVRVRVRLPAY
jgi:hypothetical protein